MRLATLARQRLAQRDIVRPQVARRELRRLVLDCVGLEIRHGLGSGCVPPILAQSAHARRYGARRSTITAVHTSCGTRNGLLRTEEKALRPQHGGPPGRDQARDRTRSRKPFPEFGEEPKKKPRTRRGSRKLRCG